MRGLWIAGWLLLCGCGRIAFDPIADGATTDESSPSPCLPWTPATRFTTPVRVAELGSPAEEQQPHTSADGLAIYFASMRSGAFRIYVATRAALDQPFANIRSMDEVNATTGFDVSFAPTLDQLTAYLSSERTGSHDLFVTQRANESQLFGTPVRLASSTGFTDYDPFQSADGLRLYWVIDLWDQGLGGTDIVVATRASVQDIFGPPSLLAGVNTASFDDNPSETADGRMLVFSAHGGGTTYDIFFATRSTTAASYEAPTIVPVINQPGVDDSEPFVTSDGCEVWFASERDGERDVYFSRVELD